MPLLVIKMTIFKVMVATDKPISLGSFLEKSGFSKQAINNAKNLGGWLLVNHKKRYTNYLVRSGDEVIFIPGKEPANLWLKPSNKPLNIIKETENYLVINKPASLLSIPSRYDDNAIVNRVLGYFARNKLTEVKPHIITRLDRDTSGLVLVGKNAIAHGRFSKISKADFVKKYHAIVHGNFSQNKLEGMIDLPIGRMNKSIKRTIDVKGKEAVTAYRVIDQIPDMSLVELRLYTGRTHQIRLHMQAIGHPLYGDQLYGIKDEFKRQALNCFYLAFPDPFAKNELVKVEVADAADMQKLWQERKFLSLT
ncbi:23S rRNA pseudouridine1911/1915/1917 synthase [Lactobacillus bombicola]|uniref:RNA pseudouridylate synthase n=2 Tax=Lactobacillus bombicola TaxID=1505723 RepID=A0A1I1SPL5_9LACO|nr:23S rRNA pseudouridine1911/1915/1917 synthase [Lactobacillus bombicola]